MAASPTRCRASPGYGSSGPGASPERVLARADGRESHRDLPPAHDGDRSREQTDQTGWAHRKQQMNANATPDSPVSPLGRHDQTGVQSPETSIVIRAFNE